MNKIQLVKIFGGVQAVLLILYVTGVASLVPGLTTAFWIGTVLMLIIVLSAFVLPPRLKPAISLKSALGRAFLAFAILTAVLIAVQLVRMNAG